MRKTKRKSCKHAGTQAGARRCHRPNSPLACAVRTATSPGVCSAENSIGLVGRITADKNDRSADRSTSRCTFLPKKLVFFCSLSFLLKQNSKFSYLIFKITKSTSLSHSQSAEAICPVPIPQQTTCRALIPRLDGMQTWQMACACFYRSQSCSCRELGVRQVVCGVCCDAIFVIL